MDVNGQPDTFSVGKMPLSHSEAKMYMKIHSETKGYVKFHSKVQGYFIFHSESERHID